ncbi:alpha/beta hydrolase domain-containing protein [Variovorax saccharolyticus]|uniref:alpha/beta hydrolase domain-containing protein n=1 Tax=Variovorax saccharolyticus TaxID=3053516 RepID=UPI0025758AE6|nr:alpha/beta hydrolase domain-containing protein [Variovorax sp. J31P216]MDM0028408.1 alpha/beta hydrolase domain-containing protein [Variovorax sp. J31P216]
MSFLSGVKSKSRWTASGLRRACVATAMSIVASAAFAVVPTPVVQGPIPSDPSSPSRNYTFFATDLDLKARGYVEEEYFFSGTANTYDATFSGGIGARPTASPTANIVTAGNPYTTRMVVRRPAHPGKFNGVVVVEWINATSNYDVEALWFRAHEFFLRDGYTWVGISAQSGPITNPTLGLKQFSPARYASLDLTAAGKFPSGDPLGYDVFAQGVQAVRHAGVLGPLSKHVRKVVGAGVSQSAGRLSVLMNAIQTRDEPVMDAVLLYIGGERLRTDLNYPIIKLLSETEYTAPASANEIAVLQPDSDLLRTWSLAGASHSDWASFAVRYSLLRRDQPTAALRDNCLNPSRSRVPDRYVISAAIDWLSRWGDKKGHSGKLVSPPASPTIQLAGDGVTVVRDAYGNSLGGIRLAPFAVPVALDSGFNDLPPGAGGLCFLNGTHIPFDTATLNQLYPTRRAYLEPFTKAVFDNWRDGFVLEEDAKEMLAQAAVSLYGRKLECGPLCANFAQFPIQPSTQLLRDHTQFLYMSGDDPILLSLDAATHAVARGYTASLTSVKTAWFTQAVGWLQKYKTQIAGQLAKGRATTQQAALLTEYADVLIAELAKLGASAAVNTALDDRLDHDRDRDAWPGKR